jgi:hypothetical protein
MMFDYPSYADMIGSTLKTMWSPLLPEKQYRDTFNAFIDAKVDLNKSIYEANKSFVEKVNEAYKNSQFK